MLGGEQYRKISFFITGHDKMAFIKLHDDLNEKKKKYITSCLQLECL